MDGGRDVMTFGLAWETWEPMYEAIRGDFGYDRGVDERARELLGGLCGNEVLRPDALPPAHGRCVGIAGGAPTLPEEIDRLEDAELLFAASTATSRLAETGIDVDVHVTDLDKDERLTVDRTAAGRPVVLHAHGDNVERLRDHVPRMDTRFVLPTTQVAPQGGVINPGGFTDGDRAAFLADALGADRIVFAGWGFDDPDVTDEKRRKLRWAARLLHWLERRRGEQFSILSDLRAELDITSFPEPRYD